MTKKDIQVGAGIKIKADSEMDVKYYPATRGAKGIITAIDENESGDIIRISWLPDRLRLWYLCYEVLRNMELTTIDKDDYVLWLLSQEAEL